MVEAPQVVADPRRQHGCAGHARRHQPSEAAAHRRPGCRKRERHQQEGHEQEQLGPRQRTGRHRRADRDDPPDRGSVPVAVRQQDRDVDDEDHHRLGQHHGVESPDVRVHRQQPGGQQTHPGPGQATAGQSPDRHRRGAQQARGQHVPGDGADPDEREHGQVGAVQRWVQGRWAAHPGGQREGVDEALAVREQARRPVVVERVADDDAVVPDQPHVGHPDDERQPGDRRQPDGEPPGGPTCSEAVACLDRHVRRLLRGCGLGGQRPDGSRPRNPMNRSTAGASSSTSTTAPKA